MINKLPAVGIGALIGGTVGIKKTSNMLSRGTAFTNPVMPSTGQKKMYGKRGIDGNRLATDGLAQNLHKNRRKV